MVVFFENTRASQSHFSVTARVRLALFLWLYLDVEILFLGLQVTYKGTLIRGRDCTPRFYERPHWTQLLERQAVSEQRRPHPGVSTQGKLLPPEETMSTVLFLSFVIT